MPNLSIKDAVKKVKDNSQNKTQSSATSTSTNASTTSASLFNTQDTQSNTNTTNPINTESEKEDEKEKNEKKNKTSNFSYFSLQSQSIKKGSSLASTMEALNQALAERNEKEKATSIIHGMSDAEYQEYQKLMYEQYGIILENGYNYGHFQNVAVAMGESNSNSTRFNAACKAAQSYDSVLDLVLDAKLTAAIADIFKNDTDPNWGRLASSGMNGRLIRDYGIKIVQCGDRQYCVSLVDKDGNVIQDSDGHLAQVYKSDMLMPDGQAQQNEVHVSAALDAMGYDCWSVLDLTPEEYQMVKEMAKLDNSQLGSSSHFRGDNELAIRNEVLGTYDQSTHTWTKAKKQDNSAWLAGTYVDMVTGETTGARKRYSQFLRERDAGYYRGKSGYNGVPSGLEGYGGEISMHFSGSGKYSGAASDMVGEVDNENAAIYYNPDGSLKSKTEIMRNAQEALNSFVDNALFNDDSMTIDEATSNGNKRLKLEKLGLKYTGYKKDRIVQNSSKVNESSDKTVVYTNANDAQRALNEYVDKLMEKDSSLTAKEAADRANKKLNIEKFDLKYTGDKNKQA